jgi:hypothetical protein
MARKRKTTEQIVADAILKYDREKKAARRVVCLNVMKVIGGIVAAALASFLAMLAAKAAGVVAR